jgi:hypothetical protein
MTRLDSVTTIDADTLRSAYHLPIEQAAKKLGVCVTVLKRICRTQNISRWPYRKVCLHLISVFHLITKSTIVTAEKFKQDDILH